MADISRMSRFVAGMPRSIDLQSNALVVGSLKVGASEPVEITKTMSQLLADINTGSSGGKGLLAANIATSAIDDSTIEKVGVYGPVVAIATAATSTSAPLALPFDRYVGQAFTTVGAIDVTAAKFYLESDYTSGVSIEAKIFATSAGVPTGAALATSTPFTNGSTFSKQLAAFNFASPVSLSATTQYAVVLKFTVEPTSGTGVVVYGDSGYADGTIVYSTDQGANWLTETSDYYCDIYVSVITSYQLAVKDAGITGAKLAASAKQVVLESKVAAFRTTVINFSSGGLDDVVTTEVEAAAKSGAVPRTGANVAAVTLPGIYVGTVSGPSSLGKVLVRATGTDNGIYGAEDEVYAKLTEATGVYTLSYFETLIGVETAFAMPAATAVDFYFVELYDMYAIPTDRFLMAPVGGVVDATSVGTTSDLQTLVSGAAGTATSLSYSPDLVYVADGTTVKAAIVALDGAADGLQVELDTTQATVGSFMDGDGGVLGFTGTTYLDAALTITEGLEALDIAIDGVADLISGASVDASIVEFPYTGGSLAAGDVTYLKAQDGKLWRANASLLASSEGVVGVVKEVIEGGTPTVKVTVAGKTLVNCASGDLDIGKRAYLSLVSGEATKTAPSTAEEVVYLLGVIVAGSGTQYTMILQPSLQYVVE